MFDFGGFKATKLKAQLKMAVSRFAIASNKKTAIMKQNMREVAVLLAEEPPREEKARIKAEALIRDDNMIEAYEILQLECELLSERIKLLESQKECPPDLVSTISDLIYATPRVDIPELTEIRKQFRAKYGKEFEQAAMENRGGVLNDRVVSKLSIHPPVAYLVQTYLEKIADQYEVDWQPTIKLSADQMIEPMAAPVGFSVQAAQGTGLGPDAHQAMTGTENTDENAIPPAAPAGFAGPSGPVVSATAYTPQPQGGRDSTSAKNLPSTAPTSNPTRDSGESGTTANDDNSGAYDEVDIFVPHVPTAPPSDAKSKKKGDDDDDDDQGSNNTNQKPPTTGGPTSGGSGGGSSYEDLAARFEQLGK